MAAGNWRLATGDWQLATGGWQAARGLKMNVFQSISTYFFLLRLATGNWRLASCTWLNDEPISKYFNLFPFGQLAASNWQAARGLTMYLFQNISIYFFFYGWQLAAGGLQMV
jgi:hypothetical protein